MKNQIKELQKTVATLCGVIRELEAELKVFKDAKALHTARTNEGLQKAKQRGKTLGRRPLPDVVRLAIIEDIKDELTPRQICERHGISRATYYRVIDSIRA